MTHFLYCKNGYCLSTASVLILASVVSKLFLLEELYSTEVYVNVVQRKWEV